MYLVFCTECLAFSGLIILQPQRFNSSKKSFLNVTHTSSSPPVLGSWTSLFLQPPVLVANLQITWDFIKVFHWHVCLSHGSMGAREIVHPSLCLEGSGLRLKAFKSETAGFKPVLPLTILTSSISSSIKWRSYALKGDTIKTYEFLSLLYGLPFYWTDVFWTSGPSLQEKRCHKRYAGWGGCKREATWAVEQPAFWWHVFRRWWWGVMGWF